MIDLSADIPHGRSRVEGLELPECFDERLFHHKFQRKHIPVTDLVHHQVRQGMHPIAIDTMLPTELNRLKAMVTQRYVDERPPYGRNKVHLPHVASFVATGNNLRFLTDDTGNRRRLPF